MDCLFFECFRGRRRKGQKGDVVVFFLSFETLTFFPRKKKKLDQTPPPPIPNPNPLSSAIACYLLHAKDRHNGNIMISRDGHLVHIDFGFILGISPGGNLGFETAAFKLSHEMSQLLDPGGQRDSPQFEGFVELCVRGFLAARGAAEPIIAAVSLMRDSGLPCFGYGAPLEALRARFMLGMTDAQAGAAFRERVDNAYDNFSTGFYDFVQYAQNAIPK